MDLIAIVPDDKDTSDVELDDGGSDIDIGDMIDMDASQNDAYDGLTDDEEPVVLANLNVRAGGGDAAQLLVGPQAGANAAEAVGVEGIKCCCLFCLVLFIRLYGYCFCLLVELG